MFNHINQPLISIITSTYNAAEHLPHLIESIKEQTYKNIEWIVVDGNSIDGTIDILRENEDIISYWISEPDNGVYEAWNKVLPRANGEWIYFIGADDFFWGRDAVERIVDILVTIPKNILIAYAKVMLISNYSNDELDILGRPWEKTKKTFKSISSIPHQGVIHRKVLFEKYGKFNDLFRITGDYEFLLRHLKNNDAFFMDEIITGMRNSGISSQWENATTIMKEIRLAQKINGLRIPRILWATRYVCLMILIFLCKIFGRKNIFRIIDFITPLKLNQRFG